MVKKWTYLILILLVFYTRFSGLKWGYPYPFHPDENNMVRSVEALGCENEDNFSLSFRYLKDCLNPHFFAYGQPPLYASYFISNLIPSIDSRYALRIIAALSSIINAFVLLKIIQLLLKNSRSGTLNVISYFLLIIFSPYFIQFSHFGTTESLLMLLYSLIVYFLISRLERKEFTLKDIFCVGVISALAIAVKISSFIFIAPILIVFIYFFLSQIRNNIRFKIILNLLMKFLVKVVLFLMITALGFIIFSPHNIISLSDFISSIKYEIAVGRGTVKVFYTQQFEYSVPILFQFFSIFPYVLGIPQLLCSIIGLVYTLRYRTRGNKILLISTLIYSVPSLFLYAKWTRFLSPIFPFLTVYAAIGLYWVYTLLTKRYEKYFKIINCLYIFIVILTIIPGIAYFTIYKNQDVRLEATKWIYKNISSGSYILSEAGNVVDIPLYIEPTSLNSSMPNYQVASFDFYNLDHDEVLQNNLRQYVENADYIFVPSRRVFANYTCSWPSESLSTKRKLIDIYDSNRCNKLFQQFSFNGEYYKNLLSGNLRFVKTAEFTSYPRIEILGKVLIEFPDEKAEETWTTFDHPVIRIYKKI